MKPHLFRRYDHSGGGVTYLLLDRLMFAFAINEGGAPINVSLLIGRVTRGSPFRAYVYFYVCGRRFFRTFYPW